MEVRQSLIADDVKLLRGFQLRLSNDADRVWVWFDVATRLRVKAALQILCA